MSRVMLMAGLLSIWCGIAAGQLAPSSWMRLMTVAPAAPSSRAMEWTLLVAPSEQVEGNAALMYGQAMALLGTISDEERQELDAMSQGMWRDDSGARLMARVEAVLVLIEHASRRTGCEWGRPIWEAAPMQVAEAPYLRLMGVIVAARARVEIRRGDPTGALSWIRVGIELARDVARGPTIVHGVIGLSIAERMADLIGAYAGMPGAPGLSWALAELGERPIDIGPGVRNERSMTNHGGVSLERLDAASEWTAEDLERVDRLLNGETEGGGPPSKSGWAFAARSAAVYARASALLASRGWEREAVQAKSVREVAVRYNLATYLSLRDELFKWMEVPYPEGWQGLERAQREIKAARERGEVGALAAQLPDMGSLALTRARVERRFALLRAVEAVREHMGASGGEWPSSLDAVAGVRVGRDPMTGRAFIYRVEVASGGGGGEGGGVMIADDGSALERGGLKLIKRGG